MSADMNSMIDTYIHEYFALKRKLDEHVSDNTVSSIIVHHDLEVKLSDMKKELFILRSVVNDGVLSPKDAILDNWLDLYNTLPDAAKPDALGYLDNAVTKVQSGQQGGAKKSKKKPSAAPRKKVAKK